MCVITGLYVCVCITFNEVLPRLYAWIDSIGGALDLMYVQVFDMHIVVQFKT